MDDLIQFLPPEAMVAEYVVSTLSEVVDWGHTFLNIDVAQKRASGEGVVVAVLDTGAPNHIDLNDNCLPGLTTLPGDEFDRQGHGCIMPYDKVFTSLHGVIDIESVYNSVMPDSIWSIPKDNAVINYIESQNIKTISYDANCGFTKKNIKAIHKINYFGKMLKVNFKDYSLNLTPWHPVYCVSSRRGGEVSITKKRAEDIKVGDSVLASDRCARETEFEEKILNFYQPVICRYCGHEPKHGNNLLVQCRQCNRHKWQSEGNPKKITLNEDLAFLLGLIASGGHISKNGQFIEFHNKNEVLVNKFEEIVCDLFDLQAKRYNVNQDIIRTRVFSVRLVGFLNTYFGFKLGEKSTTLEFPKILETCSLKVIGAFLAGCIEGDGNVDSNRIRLRTASEKFAKQTSTLLNFLGVRSFYTENKDDNYFHIRISPFQELADSMIVKKITVNYRNRITNSVLSVEEYEYSGFVYDFTIEGTSNYVANGYVVSNTHCAGIIAALQNGTGVVGVAPKAKILPIKVLDDQGQGTYQSIIDGINLAVERKVDIISMSLGCPRPHQGLQDAIRRAYEAGVILIAAAGNSHGEVEYPAAYPEVIAVSAVDKHGKIADFSCRGDAVDAAAPGVDVYSTYLNNQYALLSGTSQAAPYIAGVCALMLSYAKNNEEAEQIKNSQDMLKVLSEVCDHNSVVAKKEYGFGIPKFANYMPWEN